MMIPGQAMADRPAEHGQVLSYDPQKEKSGDTRDMVREVHDRLTLAFDHDRHNRDTAAAAMKFLAGDQWPEYARAQRANRPMLTINKLPQFLHQVTNDIRKNSPVIKVTPVGAGDPALAQVFDGIISDIQYRSSAKHIYATGGYHAAACGIGHWRVKSQYQDEDTFDQELRVELVPYPLSVYWDPASVKPDRSDAMWCIVLDMVPSSTFRSRYPDAKEASVAGARSTTHSSGIYWHTSDYILVAEYWCKKPTKRTLTAFESGATFDTSKMDMMQLYQIGQMHGQVVRRREVDSHRVEQSIVTGAEILSGPNQWPGRYIPIIPVIGTEIPLERTTIRKGLIHDAMDAQQLYNFYRSAAAEHIALSPKSPYLVTDQMISKHKAAWDTLHKTNRPYVSYTPDPDATGQSGKPERVQAPEPPQALWREAQIATDDLKATTGIYDAQMGAQSNETSGVAIKRREQQGQTANFHYQDNLALSIEHTGRILVDLIPKIYDNERVVRLMLESGDAQMVAINHTLYDGEGQPVLLNDLSAGRFDVRVVIGPSYQTKRLEASQAIVELMQAVGPQLAPLIAPIAVRNMDIPDAEEAAEILGRAVGAMMPPDPNAQPAEPDPLQQHMQMLEVSGVEAEVTGMHLENALKEKQLAAPIMPPDRSAGPPRR